VLCTTTRTWSLGPSLVTEAALNLFINTNAQELLQEMKPDIKQKMILKTRNFVNRLFTRIPYDMWMLE